MKAAFMIQQIEVDIDLSTGSLTLISCEGRAHSSFTFFLSLSQNSVMFCDCDISAKYMMKTDAQAKKKREGTHSHGGVVNMDL